jgi:dihydroorotate dehydrogenase (fumarate)
VAGVDLSTRYLGLALCSPIIASASPLTRDIGAIRQLEDAGAGAVVLPSLFEEQIRAEARLTEALIEVGADSSPEAGSYFPASITYNSGPSCYLDLISRARAAIDIPVIASLNGSTPSGWTDFAKLIEEAGASALELNIYRIATGAAVTGGEAEADCVALVGAVRRQVKIPLAVKLHPHFSAFGAMARDLDRAGADGLVLFNRLYQPDIDLVRLGWRNEVALSSAAEIRLGLLWISELSGRVSQASLAASTGVESADEVVKYLLAGADAVMTTSALLRHGPAHLRILVDGLSAWLASREFSSVAAIRGLMARKDPGAEIRERDDYIQSLLNFRPQGHRAQTR